MSKMYNVRIPDELSDKVEELAQEFDRSKSYIVKKAIEEYIGEYRDAMIAKKRLEDKKDKIITDAEMRRRLGIKSSL
jgi:RHH-type transcriptional regulator, rel operon repressor / antitoxin RelB